MLQACYFANPLPVESASTVPCNYPEYQNVTDMKTRSGVCVYETVDYPLKALVFSSNNANALVNVVSEACLTLRENNTAHSLMISNSGSNVFLFPQV
jgi:GDP-L-galactose phosphorylase